MADRINIGVSIVIATFNSEKVLERTLNAIAKQSYPQEDIEILIVDGGSTDQTLLIAQKFHCKIVNNPKTEPVNAKLLGAQNAHGKYLIYVDHDEVFENRDSIKNRVNALQEHPECKAAFCSGYKRPPQYPALNQYISEFGDPFSCFIYHTSKDYNFFYKFLLKNYTLINEYDDYYIFSFENSKKNIIVELCCLGTMIDLEYFKSTTNMLLDPNQLVQLFYLMLEQKKFLVIVDKNDALLHYSVDSIKAYLPKLKWRIRNNVHYVDKAQQGFGGRTAFQKGVNLKKYLFVLYTIFFPASFVHATYLAITRKNSVYLLHPFLCIYVVYHIGIEMIKKWIGIKPIFTSYDGKKKIGG